MSRSLEPPGRLGVRVADDDYYREWSDRTGGRRGGWEKRTVVDTRDKPDGVCEHRKRVIIVRVNLASDSVGSN